MKKYNFKKIHSIKNSKDILNKYLSVKFNKIDIYNIELYKSFFIFKNLKKN